ncbi:MAG TPA: hypothetical protein VFF73_20685 [Planctomycetota bacterium]|nr:hypothetical protein [Planctomycetota bacterium]
MKGTGTSAYELLPAEKAGRIECELDRGESVLWAGEPRPWSRARSAFAIWLFAVPWTAFAVFWMGGAALSGAPLPFVLFGTPFVLVGIGLLSLPFWAMRAARRTCYALTDRRVIALEGGLGSIVTRSYLPDQLGRMTRTERSDGSGDLVIEAREWRDSDGDRRTIKNGLMGIDRVREVERLIRSTLLGGCS